MPFNGGFAPIFWFIDEFKKVRSGKIMNYHMVDGEPKRTKFDKTYKNIKWLHSRMDDFNFRMCSFGSHLLPLRPNDAVHIVESEKTALIMACVRPQHIWLATSSVTNLQEHILPTLEGRDVVLHPDKGERSFGYWKIKAKEFLNKNLVKSIKVSRFVEESEFLEEGDDIADYIIKAVKNESSKENQPRENSFISIETVPQETELAKEGLMHNSWTERVDDSDSYTETAPLFAEFGKIFCVSLGYVKNHHLNIKTIQGDEKEIIETVFRW